MPDIMYFNLENFNAVKTFEAIPFGLKDNLVYSYLASGRFDSFCQKSRIQSDPSFHEVVQAGEAFEFNGTTSYLQSSEMEEMYLRSNFSVFVSFRMNEEALRERQSLVGKGILFNIKMIDRFLTFTHVGVDDIILNKYAFESGKWYDILVTAEGGKELKFYVNGDWAGTYKLGKLEESTKALVVGNNVWDEFFRGSIKDVLVWNRILSAEEAKMLRQMEKEPVPYFHYALSAIAVLWGGFMIAFYLRK